jgi:hypothetical protein
MATSMWEVVGHWFDAKAVVFVSEPLDPVTITATTSAGLSAPRYDFEFTIR